MGKASPRVAGRPQADVPEPRAGSPSRPVRASFTQVPDWAMLCERINSTAFRLWCILRSMQFENGPGIPPLTLDEICWLLPGVKGKPTSRTRAREAVDSLLCEGLLEDVSPEETPLGAPRLYLAVDRPAKAMGHSGARRKLGRYHRLWRKG